MQGVVIKGWNRIVVGSNPCTGWNKNEDRNDLLCITDQVLIR